MKILIAVDGSPHTRKALDFLANHRASFVTGHTLLIVHVCVGIPGHVARHVSKDVVTGYYADESAKVIEPVKQDLAERGIVNYEVELCHGHAAEEILKVAATANADLIVLGTHGQGMFDRVLMGSVATKVIADSSRAVLLVQ